MLKGQKVLAEDYSMRVMQDGVRSYFILGKLKETAGEKADQIASFLSIDGNRVEEALVLYSESHKNKALRTAKIPVPVEAAPTVDSIISCFLAVTGHLSPMTRRNNTQALRHIAAGILGLPKLGINQTKAQRIK